MKKIMVGHGAPDPQFYPCLIQFTTNFAQKSLTYGKFDYCMDYIFFLLQGNGVYI